ncbi:MAG: hypothetical protein HYT87_04800 [Nitrospirae bacterium]|nr:hypothetical protein [Nitrospirota bacterium]
MKSALRNLLGLFLIATAFTGAVCGTETPPDSGDIEKLVSKLYVNSNDAQAQQDLLKALATAKSDICTTDKDGNGVVPAMDVVNLAKSRISNAPIEKPASTSATSDAAAKTNTELFLERISAVCPEHKAEANFTKTMFKVGQAIAPISDLLGLTSVFSGGGTPDINKLIGPITGILTPETPCADKGLAQCGKEMSDAVDAMGADISAKTYELTDVTVTVDTTTANLSGKYNEATLRTIGAVGSMVHGLFYFLAAHVDLTALLPEITPLIPLFTGGGLGFDTAGQILTTVDALDGVIVKVLEGPIDPTTRAVSSAGSEKLATSRDSTAQAIKWINEDGKSKPVIITAVEQSKEDGLGVRFYDDNGNATLDGCDEIQVNLGFVSQFLSDFYMTANAEGCTGGVRSSSFELPAKSGDKNIDYTKLFSGAAATLSQFQSAVSNKSLPIAARDLNTILVAVGEDEIKDVFQIYPGVVFESGLSFMTPGKPGTAAGKASALKDYFEMEISADAPACPDGKTKDGAFVCKSKDGKSDQSKLISRGDADHFGGAVTKDSIYVTEKLLDVNAKKADDTFRAAEGGGFLPYLLFKNADLKGFAKVSNTLITEMTTAVADAEADGICKRKIAQTSGSMVPVDARFMNALINFGLVQSMACGVDSQLGGLLGGMDISSGLSIPGLTASAR